MHDFYNHVLLYLTSPEQMRTHWYVPKNIAERVRDFFCPADSSLCIFTFGTFRFYGLNNMRTGHVVTLLYEKGAWLALAMLPWMILYACLHFCKVLSVKRKRSETKFTLKILLGLSFFALLFHQGFETRIHVIQQGLTRQNPATAEAIFPQ